MPRYLHIPHTPDTVRTLTLSGRNCSLKGVPVKPTDDVDVDKEYQLIPIDSL